MTPIPAYYSCIPGRTTPMLLEGREGEGTDHLGCPTVGEATYISGDQIDPCVGHSDVARVSVHQTLVVHLRSTGNMP